MGWDEWGWMGWGTVRAMERERIRTGRVGSGLRIQRFGRIVLTWEGEPLRHSRCATIR